jgi:hypothetical protein
MSALTLRWHDETLAVATVPVDANVARGADSAPIQGELHTSAGRTVILAHQHTDELGPDARV